MFTWTQKPIVFSYLKFITFSFFWKKKINFKISSENFVDRRAMKIKTRNNTSGWSHTHTHTELKNIKWKVTIRFFSYLMDKNSKWFEWLDLLLLFLLLIIIIIIKHIPLCILGFQKQENQKKKKKILVALRVYCVLCVLNTFFFSILVLFHIYEKKTSGGSMETRKCQIRSQCKRAGVSCPYPTLLLMFLSSTTTTILSIVVFKRLWSSTTTTTTTLSSYFQRTDRTTNLNNQSNDDHQEA